MHEMGHLTIILCMPVRALKKCELFLDKKNIQNFKMILHLSSAVLSRPGVLPPQPGLHAGLCVRYAEQIGEKIRNKRESEPDSF